MQRIQDPTAVTSLPAPPSLVGQPIGFFQGSIAGGIVTRIRYWWLNMIQEELIAILAAAGLALDGTQTVLAALKLLFNSTASYTGANSGIITLPGGVYLQSCTAQVPAGNGLTSTTVNLPIAFPTNTLEAQVCYLGNTPPLGPGTISVQPLNRSQVVVTTNFGSGTSSVQGVAITTKGN